MTPQQIKDNAPEGATHYLVNKYTGVTYLKMGDNITGNYFDCKAYVKNRWCGELTMKKCWFFKTYYVVSFDSSPLAKADAHIL